MGALQKGECPIPTHYTCMNTLSEEREPRLRRRLVRYLLEAGANRTLVNREGKTPRQLAEERGFAEVAALFE